MFLSTNVYILQIFLVTIEIFCIKTKSYIALIIYVLDSADILIIFNIYGSAESETGLITISNL